MEDRDSVEDEDSDEYDSVTEEEDDDSGERIIIPSDNRLLNLHVKYCPVIIIAAVSP